MWQKQNKTAAAILCLTALLLIIVGLLWKGSGSFGGIGGKIGDAAMAAGKPVQQISSGIRDGVRGIFRFKAQVRETEQMQNQLNRLRKENADLKLEESEYRELQELSRIFSYDRLEYQKLQGANVLAASESRWMYNFTVDRGSSSGVKKGDAVLSGDGLIGRIAEVSPYHAKVLSLMDEGSKVSFYTEKNPDVLGMVRGDGEGGLTGYLLRNQGEIQKGDKLKTSGMGAYPKGFVIGEVTKVWDGCGQQRIRFDVRPAADPKTVKKVAVVL